ncbi:hypothetical protein AGMMS49928_04800 [Spirochaetia bacterium]|nr:hypothetical protein AGMMS49928_04800 [Spirochaetia bacterium]
MSLFCFLWTPLLYLFRRSLVKDSGGSGGVWALLLGSVVAILQFFFGSLVNPGGFGFSRWVSACIDIVSLPAVLPLLVFVLFTLLKVFSGPGDFTNFALLWLIPGAAIRTLSWSAQNDPVLLILSPLLWTAIALSIPFLANFFKTRKIWLMCLAGLGILALPLLAAAAWWAFFSQRTVMGFFFLFVTIVPAFLSLVFPHPVGQSPGLQSDDKKQPLNPLLRLRSSLRQYTSALWQKLPW